MKLLHSLHTLDHLQKHLSTIYALPSLGEIRQFMIDLETLKKLHPTSFEESKIGEKIILRSNEDSSVDIALYLQEEILKNLGKNCPEDDLNEENLADFCTVVEGISHFLFVGFRTQMTLPISAIELELQAEIDKFIASFIYCYQQSGSTQFVDSLYQAIFHHFQFKSDLDSQEMERYHLASTSAAKLCKFLLRKFLKHEPDWPGLLSFLRHFYRQGWNSKFSTISESSFK